MADKDRRVNQSKLQVFKGLVARLGQVHFCLVPAILGILLMYPVRTFAARNATVTKERAIIWADAQRSAPIGYARQGKVLRVGEKEREKGQVLPVIVSGRIGYISVDDIVIDEDRKADTDEDRQLTRFQKATKQRYRDYAMGSLVFYSATESANTAAGRPQKQWVFSGGQLKGEVRTTNDRLNVNFLFEYLYGVSENEAFRMFELGAGVSYAVWNRRDFKIRLEAAGLFVPWAQYESAPFFTLNGYGAGAYAQASAIYFFSETWGVEVAGGFHAMKLMGIDRPSPFKDFSPLFIGQRFQLGLSGRF